MKILESEETSVSSGAWLTFRRTAAENSTETRTNVNIGTAKAESTMQDLMQDMHQAWFATALSAYFSTKGKQQRDLRLKLWNSIQKSEDPKRKLQLALEKVFSLNSQSSLPAAIDLLEVFNRLLVPALLSIVLTDKIQNSNAAYALAMAAGRADPNIISILLNSRHEVMREAALEILSTLAPYESKVPLQRVSETDPSSMLRQRALELLAEVE